MLAFCALRLFDKNAFVLFLFHTHPPFLSHFLFLFLLSFCFFFSLTHSLSRFISSLLSFVSLSFSWKNVVCGGTTLLLGPAVARFGIGKRAFPLGMCGLTCELFSGVVAVVMNLFVTWFTGHRIFIIMLPTWATILERMKQTEFFPILNRRKWKILSRNGSFNWRKKFHLSIHWLRREPIVLAIFVFLPIFLLSP